MSLQDLADATRIRPAYLAALEELKLELLPSRPFTIGYVRAVAQALGADPGQAVARFKRDVPDHSEPLRGPVGVTRERDPRLPWAGGVAAVVLAAFLIWNLAQHALAEDAAPAPIAPDAAVPARPAAPKGAVSLSAALPAPADSQGPAPYVTPGLVEADLAANDPVAAAALAAASAALKAQPAAAAAPIAPRLALKAAVYGAAADQASAVTLQARKPASLVVRGANGSVYFARQLALGETYRAPQLKGLTIDVSDPGAFDVYAFGAFKGQLPAAQVPVAKLEGPAVKAEG